MRKGLRLLFVLLAGLVLGACGERMGKEINGGIAVLETAPRKTETRPVRGVPETRGMPETRKAAETPPPPAAPEKGGDAEVDLTVLSSIMVYSEIWNMMKAPENYIGKTIKMRGQFVCAGDQEEGKRYFGCLVADAAQCCSQGLEFVLAGEHVYPDDYPALNSRITVTGTFETYQVKGIEYCRIVDAVLECESN